MKVIQSIYNDFTSGAIWSDMYISCYRIFMGFIYATVLGVVLGILAGCYKPFEAFIQPMVEFLRYLPVPAFVPLIMVWVGIDESAKIAVIFIGTLFQLIPMVADDIRSVPDDYVNAAYTLGARRRTVIFKILIPGMMPRLFETLRMMMGWAWTYLVVAELVAANSGLGYKILKAQRYLKTGTIFEGIIVIGLLGLILDRVFGLIGKKLFKWAEGGTK
ncbi:ABC transporter permease [Treponema ruminis]|uniref:NitT/TauT family transport system permease protein n=1 Tax=Treponema ruminis TaxID=744515 RepID=A0A7W8G711_9SPIR|nr:ABC transporter permease [Treponema ruminis]MBB5225043.1 NitT/TauT family transport system permease protein [Treponema ruminis]